MQRPWRGNDGEAAKMAGHNAFSQYWRLGNAGARGCNPRSRCFPAGSAPDKTAAVGAFADDFDEIIHNKAIGAGDGASGNGWVKAR